MKAVYMLYMRVYRLVSLSVRRFVVKSGEMENWQRLDNCDASYPSVGPPDGSTIGPTVRHASVHNVKIAKFANKCRSRQPQLQINALADKRGSRQTR